MCYNSSKSLYLWFKEFLTIGNYTSYPEAWKQLIYLQKGCEKWSKYLSAYWPYQSSSLAS